MVRVWLRQQAGAPEPLVRVWIMPAAAAEAMESQNEAGVWVVPKIADYMGSIGAVFYTESGQVRSILRYIEAARIAKGELAPIWRGDGNVRQMAYPEDGWYDVAWDEAG